MTGLRHSLPEARLSTAAGCPDTLCVGSKAEDLPSSRDGYPCSAEPVHQALHCRTDHVCACCKAVCTGRLYIQPGSSVQGRLFSSNNPVWQLLLMTLVL